MEIELSQAIKIFFSTSSFEMIYLESFANALDAGATIFDISIKLDSYSDFSSLKIILKDNGVGFTEERFEKFSKLLSVHDKNHKGLGRLVYLCYFDNVEIDSQFDNTKHRNFNFHINYKKENQVIEDTKRENGSILTLTKFNNVRLHKNENIRAFYIKRLLLENFYMKFLDAKLQKKEITVNIQTNIEGKKEKITITNEDIPEFSIYHIPNADILFEELNVYYHISPHKDNHSHSIFVTSLSIDGRNMNIDIVSKENVSDNYNMIFILKSQSFSGATDPTRQTIKIEEGRLNTLKALFRKAINQIISDNIPSIASANRKQFKVITSRFPHLAGLIDEDCVGFLSYNEVLKRAQDKYFNTERELLGAEELSAEQYSRSIEYSSRALANYIIYREKVIKTLRNVTNQETEIDLHNLLCPRFNSYYKKTLTEDIYSNNIWVLDDRFMSYDVVLSEAEMTDVLKIISPTSERTNTDRPDISIFFSRNPKIDTQPFEIVIVELKRMGISPEMTSIVEFQLDTRTQQLAEMYDSRIEKAWFYGIVDFNPKYETHLRNEGFSRQFSHGKIYHRSKPIFVDEFSERRVQQEAFIMDFHALVEDAAVRNSTFLKILQKKIEESSQIV